MMLGGRCFYLMFLLVFFFKSLLPLLPFFVSYFFRLKNPPLRDFSYNKNVVLALRKQKISKVRVALRRRNRSTKKNMEAMMMCEGISGKEPRPGGHRSSDCSVLLGMESFDYS